MKQQRLRTYLASTPDWRQFILIPLVKIPSNAEARSMLARLMRTIRAEGGTIKVRSEGVVRVP